MAQTMITTLALLLLLASPGLAQETEEPSAEDPAADAITDDGLSMGVPADGEGLGKPYIAAQFEAWEQRCLRTDLGADPCELYYLLKDDQGAAVAEFSIYGLPEGSAGPAVAGATFMAPLETLLTAGVTMQIDDGELKAYPFSVCSPAGCLVRLGFTAEEVDTMKQGAEIIMTLVPFVAPDQKVPLTLSLAGFTAGMDAVDAANAAADAAAAAAGGEAAPAP